MCFLNWQVLLNDEVLEPEVATNYITFDDINSPDTKITINARIENLTVKANVAKRPTIVKASPQSDETGVYRDRTVVVQFSQDIDESTIYFTADELKELGVSTSKAFPVENGSKYYYAYWDGSDENSYVFKNITITNYQFTNVNYLRYFDVPKLDSKNKKILRISTKVDTSTTPATSIAPPSATEILVTLNKNIAAKVENKSVGLSDDYGWTYFTNGSTDVTPPEFLTTDKNGFIVTVADDNQIEFDSTKPSETTNTFINNPLSNLNKLVKMNAKNKKLWLRGTFSDSGSGPARLEYKLYKISTTLYQFTNEEQSMQKQNTTTGDNEIVIVENGQFDEFTVMGPNASFNQKLDNNGKDIGGSILELPELKTEGTYRIDFTAYDKNNRPSSVKSFYFVYDTVCNIENNVFSINIVNNEFIIKINQNDSWDYGKTKIEENEINYTDEGLSFSFDSNNEKTLVITEEDRFGNINEYTKTYKLKTPKVGMIYYGGRYWSDDFDSQLTPIGVICDVTDYGKATDFSKVRIWDLEEKTGLIWGSMDSSPYADHSDSTDDPHFNTKDGLKTYNIYKNSFSGGTFDITSSYWYWLKNDKNKNSTITWYIPTYDEINNFIVGNYDVLKTAYDTLKTNGVSVTFINSVSETFKDSALTTCIPGKYDKSNEKGYTRATISYSNNKASIESNVTFRNGQSSTCHCMAQVDLTL